MTRNSPPARRGTKTLGGYSSGPAQGSKPWWRGAAVAGGLFVVLLVLAVVVNLDACPRSRQLLRGEADGR